MCWGWLGAQEVMLYAPAHLWPRVDVLDIQLQPAPHCCCDSLPQGQSHVLLLCCLKLFVQFSVLLGDEMLYQLTGPSREHPNSGRRQLKVCCCRSEA